MIVFWFRRDLRIDDNTALHEALAAGEEVFPVFIFDKNILEELPKDDARVTFIMSLLEGFNSEFKKHSRSLAVFYDTPENVFKHLLKDHDITALYANRDYEPYARKRDKAVYEVLQEKNIPFKSFKDQVIFEKSEVVKDNGEPYSVYTPYKNRWLLHFKDVQLRMHHPQIEAKSIVKHDYPFLTLTDIGFTESSIKPEPYDVSPSLIEGYENTRNYPAIEGTSKLSPYLRFGALSIRQLVKKALAAKNQTFLNELIWREFFMQLLWHYPETVTKAFKPKYDNVKWRYSEKDFKAWCEGKTGFPIVDAGMRELNATGHMHNRVRMITASFLCKQLLLDWRKGEAYFAEKLLDYEQSSNVGNWQWAASSGADASPYFRIFNPDEQVKKFDKDLKYIKKWVPEFQDIDYKPIVDYKESRERALKVYKEAVS
ncbi:deoxyribodipyrimidine photolyase [Flavobacterium akiainvivens]|uniref:Deoxyribodipyrimidine photolyase n=1 Tax=Flavobacterium akiainvivens TaxID=1202724 RepID=A0A0M8M7I2_9FLAO|nr:deoxyribodipyrimidine photo-lyase [Flavobacterium akiainvivens]KOS05003.1 deoxyribodipyrimidine photolyase [Flavobacterium akiainvivens]SFQ40545.1 deoxyribodipyrimidine photo-lyase [Flavobacterium akiainvivens]